MFTNDTENQKMTLKISGMVEKVVTISPKKVRLTGFLENEISATVKIVPEKKYAFKVLKSKANKDKYIKFDLKEIENSGNFEYLLKIENISKEKGRYFDAITLETDSKVLPQVKVKVYGNIRSKLEEEKQKKIE